MVDVAMVFIARPHSGNESGKSDADLVFRC